MGLISKFSAPRPPNPVMVAFDLAAIPWPTRIGPRLAASIATSVAVYPEIMRLQEAAHFGFMLIALFRPQPIIDPYNPMNKRSRTYTNMASFDGFCWYFRAVRAAHNGLVGGSSPPGPTIYCIFPCRSRTNVRV
jgi:hypothetical protein